jgi:pyridoxine 4-dehydrogenase
VAGAVANKSNTFLIGGTIPVARLGFGSMRLTGPGVWGPPADRAGALRVLRMLPELGVNFVDTADSYGPDVAEELICEALHPYPNLLVATKAGLARTGPNAWTPLGRPEYLIQQAYRSLQKLRVPRIGLWQLHRIDPRVPRDEQFHAVRQLLDNGVIAHAGLSEVSVADIQAAVKVFPVATVQNRYNMTDRASEPVLRYCEQHGIGFIPWFPLSAGRLTQTEARVAAIAKQYEATPGQIALAWLLRKSPVMLPIPGTSQSAHLAENVAASAIELSAEDFRSLDQSTS